MGARQERTLYITTHGDHYFHLRNVGQELAVLGRFHVNSMQLLHQPDSILVDLGLCFRTGRIAFKHIGSQLLA